MSKLASYIELTRPANGLIAAVSVLVGAVVGGSLFPPGTILLACCSGFLIASGGNAINDYFDVDIDRVNRPRRPLPSGRVSPSGSLLFSRVLLASGTLLGFSLGWKTGLIALTSSVLLVLYSHSFKRIALVGNFTVSLVAALAFLYGGMAYGRPEPALIPAWFALLFHLGREIVKDIQDSEGDTVVQARTLPLRFGSRAALAVTSYVFLILILSTMIPALFRIYNMAYLAVVVLGVDIPIIWIIRSMWNDPSPINLGRLSFILKIGMLIGLLAIFLGSR